MAIPAGRRPCGGRGLRPIAGRARQLTNRRRRDTFITAMRSDAPRRQARQQTRAPLPPLIRRGWLSRPVRVAVVLAGSGLSVLFVLLLRLEGNPTSWKG